MILEDLSEEIIGSAMAVLNTLKPGLDEKLQIRQTRLEACRALNNSRSLIRVHPWFPFFPVGFGCPFGRKDWIWESIKMTMSLRISQVPSQD